MFKWLFLTGMFIVLGQYTNAHEGSFREGQDEFRPYGFVPAERWNRVREKYAGERNFRDSLLLSLGKRKNTTLICPWWLEDLYGDPWVAGCCRDGIGYCGYVLDPLTGMPALTNEWKSRQDGCLLNTPVWQKIPYDLVVYCRGGEAFDHFLKNSEAMLNFLHRVFDWSDGMINQTHQGKRPRGLHFYLPDFSFREKKEFTQFIKSVSIIIDSLRLENGSRPYEGDQCMLYVTFGTAAWEEADFLSGITVFVDEVRFVDYDAYGVPFRVLQPLNAGNDPASFFTKLWNQFYLFHLGKYRRAEEGEYSSVDFWAQADYDDFQWQTYFFLEIVLWVFFIVLMLLYNFYSPFYMLAERNRWVIVPVIITFMTEAVILFIYVVEAISKDEILFNMQGYQHLWLLGLPLVFILLYVVFRMWGENKQLP